MGLFLFLTVIQAIVAFVLVVLVLMQRSEGGGLGIGGGGGPAGVMSARGAADFMTRATKWSAILFVALAIVLAAVAVDASGSREIDDSLDRSVSDPLEAVDPLGAPAAGPAAPGDAAAEAAPAEAAPAEAAPVDAAPADAASGDDPLADILE